MALNFRKIAQGLLFGMALVLLCGCGATLKKSAEFDPTKFQTIALLPVKTEGVISRERVQYIRRTIARQLQTSGYVLLSESFVNKICKDAACSQRAEFATKHKVNALGEINLKSVTRANFLAGYYNSIDGEFRLLTPDSRELLSVKHTEREKGGLLFNSGQVLQGLRDSVENSGDESFDNLADKFARAVVAKVPTPIAGVSLARVSDVSLTLVQVSPVGSSRYRVCAEGNPGANVALIIDRRRTPLREGTPGRYCGVLLLEGLIQPMSRVSVELKSDYGVVSQQAVDAGPLMSCVPESLVQEEPSGQYRQLALACGEGLNPEKKSACESQLKLCNASEFLIYRAERGSGTFQKIATVNRTPWIDKKSKGEQSGVYAVVAVSKNGNRSVPVTLGSNSATEAK